MAQAPGFIFKETNKVSLEYQNRLLEDAKENNTILYLPSKNGKVYLAMLLIKNMGESLTKPLGEGRKWTFFITQSTSFARRQAENLKNHLPWKITLFNNDMNIKHWLKPEWNNVLDNFHIIIMTAEIFLNNLQNDYMNIKDVNLIIFDECHLAVFNHPFNKIMKFIQKDTSKNIYIDEYILNNININEYRPIKHPRILGFTSTLIDSNTKNVKEKLTELEQIFNARIKTKYEGNAQIFSERPECLQLYDENVLDKDVVCITDRINVVIGQIEMFRICDESFNGNKDNYYMASRRPIIKTIVKYFVDLKANLNNNGAYFGYLATWHYMTEIITMDKYYLQEHTSSNTKLVLNLALTGITVIRKMLYDYMNYLTNTKNPIPTTNVSSPKLIKFMEILSTMQNTDICLVIVDCETTAKLLYHYIQEYYEHKQRNITCDFMADTKELCEINSFDESESHKIITLNEIIKKFNKKQINILITSDVLEEDVIRCCNFVIGYDYPINFLSYIQSKSKLASDGDKFIIMAPTLIQFEIIHSKYLEMEKEMKKILVHNEMNDNNYEDNLVEVFKTKCTTITQENAINILNRYCISLPQDRFTNLCPEWYIMNNFTDYKKFQLVLPINSAIRTIDGTHCKNKNNSKKSTAFYACIELYKAEALDSRMLPMQIEDKSLFTESYWFPHWDEKDLEEQASYKTDTMTHIESPSFLHGAYPCVGKPSYLHVIHCGPKYNLLINSSNEAVIKLLNSNKEFGILTSKKLPNITGFPIFLKACDIDVRINVNVHTIFLNQENHEKLETFHNKLLLDILSVKEFLCRNYSNENNSYLIVPIVSSGNFYNVDWNVVDINPLVEPHVVPTMEQRESMCLEKYFESRSVVSPWYRNLNQAEQYFVSDVKYDMTSESPFPSAGYGTYKSYFSTKYGIHLSHEKQPLIKTQMLDVNNINYLTPQIISNKIKTPDIIQILVPELCTWHAFPSDLWLKALMLPTILYRMNQLLLAEDLLMKMYSLIGGVHKYFDDTLEIDHFASDIETKKEIVFASIYDSLKYLQNSCIFTNKLDPKNMPIDIERNKNTVLLDILNYHTMLSNSINHNKNDIYPDKIDNEDFIQQTLSNFKQLNLVEKKLPPMLSSMKWDPLDYLGLNQSDILKVITPVFINDIINNKRLEICGDGFLHFAVSLVLFDAFKSENLQFLSELRMKIIGNRNLFSVGKKLNIEPYIMVNAYNPLMDWVPPCFNIPKNVKEIIEKEGVKSEFLYKVFISNEEKLSGELSKETMDIIQTELRNFQELTEISEFEYNGYKKLPETNYSPSDMFLKKQWVLNKTVVQCVKSLIGTYVHRFGFIEGFKFLHNLSIIPKAFSNVYEPESDMSDNETVQSLNYSKILPGYEILENQIGYTFQNKGLLVQAFTHPSYQSKYTECYQRLEFLGGAILDFLITSYVTDYCKQQTLKNITLIRSSIVNDCTFASLSARFGLHKFLLSRSVKLTNAIDRFYKHRLKLNHEICHEVMYYIQENDCYTEEYIDVPNVLGDIFKSLIGAIYLDSGREMEFIWMICYKFLKKEIEYFSTHTIKRPLDILKEADLKPKFREPTKTSIGSVDKGLGTVMQLDVIVNGTNMTTYGFGRNKKEAKNAAVKLALKIINKVL